MSTNRIRVLLVSLLAVFAVSAVASSSASAALKKEWQTCTNVGTGSGTKYITHSCTPAKKSEGTFEWVTLGTGVTEKVVSKGTNQILKTIIGGAALEIKCEKVKDTGTITGGKPGTDEGSIEYTECKIVGAPKCGVKSPPPTKAGTILVASVKSKLVEIEPAGSGVEGEEFSTASGTFVELELGETENATTHKFEKACGVLPKALQKITGVVVGKTESGKVNFTSPPQKGSTLKFGAETAEYIGLVEFELENGWAFRAI